MGNTGSDPAAGAEDVAKEAEKVEYVIEEVAKHKHKRDCWIVIHGWVLDVTPFLEDHPGGTSVILDHAGTPACAHVASLGAHVIACVWRRWHGQDCHVCLTPARRCVVCDDRHGRIVSVRTRRPAVVRLPARAIACALQYTLAAVRAPQV